MVYFVICYLSLCTFYFSEQSLILITRVTKLHTCRAAHSINCKVFLHRHLYLCHTQEMVCCTLPAKVHFDSIVTLSDFHSKL